MTRKCLLHKGEIQEGDKPMYFIIDSGQEGAMKYYVCSGCVRSKGNMTYGQLEKLAKRNPRIGEQYEEFGSERAQKIIDEQAAELLRQMRRGHMAAM